ncbi:MAG: hypothetical protein ABI151_15860 [Chitinophagaceae bacterium]
MNHDLLKILSESNKDIDNQKLMDYLAGHLNDAELHNVEEMMAADEFVNDAIEGLQKMESQKNIENLVRQLNNDLQKKLQVKKDRKDKRKIKEQPWVYLGIILIIALAIAGWFVIHKLRHPGL